MLVHPSRGAIYLFDGKALFNGSVEISTADLKYRHAMPTYVHIV